MKPIFRTSIEEEKQTLTEVQDVIQKQMTDRLKDLGMMRQEIIDNRKFNFEEIPPKQQFMMNQHDQVREAYYTETYKRIMELSRMYYSPYFGMISYCSVTSSPEESTTRIDATFSLFPISVWLPSGSTINSCSAATSPDTKNHCELVSGFPSYFFSAAPVCMVSVILR